MSNDENREKNEEKAAVPVQPIIDMGSTVVKNSRGTIHCLTIVGQVEGHTLLPDNLKSTKYEHVLPLLAALEQNEQVDGVLLLLNTVGGDIEAGLAIAELVAGMRLPTVTLVLGGGHSIGVPLAVCGKETFIAPSASMTIHPVRMSGLVLGVPQTLSYFDKMQDRIISFVTSNSGVSEADFRRLMMNTEELVMDVGSVVDGEKAKLAKYTEMLANVEDMLKALDK